MREFPGSPDDPIIATADFGGIEFYARIDIPSVAVVHVGEVIFVGGKKARHVPVGSLGFVQDLPRPGLIATRDNQKAKKNNQPDPRFVQRHPAPPLTSRKKTVEIPTIWIRASPPRLKLEVVVYV
jgi:hypothetical protein